MAHYKLAVIPGDGIGPEVVAEGLKVLDVVAASTASPLIRPSMNLVPSIGTRQGALRIR
jgi:isocitrate/isopropylmalate dehydrogenase